MTSCAFDGDFVVVTSEDGEMNKYPLVWLRDNCPCALCFNPTTQSRNMLMENLNVDTSVKALKVKADGIFLTWDDEHVSAYTFTWLKERSFTKETRQQRNRFYNLEMEKKHWGSQDIRDNIQIFNFDELLSNDKTLYQWLVAIETVGICKVEGVPKEIHQLYKMAARISWLRRGNYGKYFKLQVMADPIHVAHLNSPLGLHTDTTYYANKHGLLLFHCISQTTEGGESLLVDGFRAAGILKETHPEFYKILSETELEFFDVGKEEFEYHQLNVAPVHDVTGNLKWINFSNHRRTPHMNMPAESVKTVYQALKEFNNILYDPENLWEYKMAGGEMMCFDNYRVLHGRQPWIMTEGGERHMEGGYIEWDDLRSKRRVLEAKYRQQ